MSHTISSKILRYRWIIFWVLAFGYILVYFHRLCPAVVAVDMMRDLKAGGALLGLLGSAYFYPYALMQLPAGLFSDSWGPRRTITLFFGVAFIGSIILGISSSLHIAITGRTLVGIGVAMLFVPTMKVLAEWFKTDEFAMMTGIFIAMGGVGSLISTTPLALLSNRVGWRMSFVFVGLFTLLMAVLVWIFVRDRPSDKGWQNISDQSDNDSLPIGLIEGVKRVLSHAWFWPLAVWFFFDCAIFFSFGGLWGGPYLMHIYGLTRVQAGNILMMLAIGMIAGSPLLSYFSNSIIRGRKPVIVISSLFSLIITFFFAFYTDKLSITALYLLCFGMGVFTNAIVVIGFTTTKELFPVRIAGTSTGLVNLFPFLGGAIFQPLLGYILDGQGKVGESYTVQGYQYAFLVLFVCGLIAFIASLFLKETLVRE